MCVGCVGSGGVSTVTVLRECCVIPSISVCVTVCVSVTVCATDTITAITAMMLLRVWVCECLLVLTVSGVCGIRGGGRG